MASDRPFDMLSVVKFSFVIYIKFSEGRALRHLHPFVSVWFLVVSVRFSIFYFFFSIFEFINPFCGYGALSWAAKTQGFRPHLWVVAHFLRFNWTVNHITPRLNVSKLIHTDILVDYFVVD